MEGKIFIDTNILVYANNELSPFCEAARTRLNYVFENYDSVWVSRQVFREFAAVVSREMLAVGKTDFDKLAKTIRQFEMDFSVAESSAPVTKRWLELLKETRSAGKQVHDVNVAVTMMVHGVETILTHNVSDFQRFAHLINILPMIGA